MLSLCYSRVILETLFSMVSVVKRAMEKAYEVFWPDHASMWDSQNIQRDGAAHHKYHTWFYDNSVSIHKHHDIFLFENCMKNLIRFRLGCSSLLVNDHVKPRNQRLCTLCSGNVIEDEKHFLLECLAYAHIRSHFDYKELWNKPDIDMNAFSNQDEQELFSKALHAIFKYRGMQISTT